MRNRTTGALTAPVGSPTNSSTSRQDDPLTHPDEVNLSQIARMAGVGRAAAVNWRRRHGGLNTTGCTQESPTFSRAAAEQWLRALGKLPQTGTADPATLVFEVGQTVTAYIPDLRVPGPGDRYGQ
ncbi:hypothetical protein ACIPN8_37370 [Streptomyces sp. NPDC086082]|uniref:hypothetical protein n=1 Tax=Streptomyces sp. NPDC086082 TaxID=3365750 RepID=UPI0038136EBA